METRTSTGHISKQPTPIRRRPARSAVYLWWAAALVTGGNAAYAAPLCPGPLPPIPDAACAPPHDPAHDRDHNFHRSCEHYRHLHFFHRGKAGTAQLAVRTLIDSKGMAVFEATTGTFDDGSVPPGSIDQVQIRITHPDQKRFDNLTFNPKQSSGYFTTPLGHLVHGQAMTVDAIISGIDRGRDEVSVDDTVQYRPDLSVSHMDVPATVSQGLPVSIAATVREIMGDLGATADCILSADGTVVDRVSNMWVDAGGLVTCHFTATFASLGQHAVHVEVANVRPADYDMSNNGGDGTVMVAAPFAFTANAYDATYSGTNVTEVLDANGSLIYDENDTFGGSDQSVSLNGNWGMPVTFPLASVSAMATSAGTTWSMINVANLPVGFLRFRLPAPAAPAMTRPATTGLPSAPRP